LLDEHLSFSTLVIPCERALKLKLEGKKPEVLPADETVRGKKIHRLMQECIENNNFVPLTEIMEIHGDPCEAWRPFTGKKKYEEKIEYIVDGKRIIGFVDVFIYNPPNQVTIIDHKTSFHATITERAKKQMQYYALPFLLQDCQVKCYINFVSWSLILPCGEYQGWEDICQIESSSWCQYCPYMLSCPEKPTKMPVDNENAKKLAENYIRHTLQVKEEAKLLRAWCDKNGVVVVGDQAVGFHEAEKYEVDPAILDWATKSKFPLEQIISISTQKVKRIAKENPDVNNYISIELTPKFGVKKWEEKETKETIPF